MRIGVVGAGSWGTALANHLVRNGHEVVIWAREPEVVIAINESGVNSPFLPDCPLESGLRATGTIAEAVVGAELVVSAAPSHAVRSVAGGVLDALGAAPTAVIVSVSKGLEPETHLTMTDLLAEVFDGGGNSRGGRIVALSGPSFALEVYQGMPTAVVAASSDQAAARVTQETFSARLGAHDVPCESGSEDHPASLMNPSRRPAEHFPDSLFFFP